MKYYPRMFLEGLSKIHEQNASTAIVLAKT